MIAVALVAAVAVVLVGVLLAAAGAVRASLLVEAVGAALLALGGGLALGDGASAGQGFASGIGLRVGVDPFSGAFLLVLGVVACAACLQASATVPAVGGGRARALGALTGLFVLALAGFLCARDAILLLAAWEAMTLLPAAAILAYRPDDVALRTVFVYVALTHVGGAGTWLAILLLARYGALADAPAPLPASTQVAVLVAALIGFGTKAGVAPFHVWLPRAHPIAPAHLSALMSGVMVKVALYGLFRVVLEWAGPAPAWLGYVVLALGAVSAAGGVLYALFQRDLKRLLAYSTIENVGIVLLGLGAGLLLQHAGADAWAGVAIAGSLLHVLAHGLAKGLLFLSAGSIDRAVHGLALDRLGGLYARMPWTGTGMLVGAAALAGLPPLVGFASEWLTLQGLAHVVLDGGDATAGIAAALALVALALTAGLAVVLVVQACGLVLLGPPRRRASREAVEAGREARAAGVLLGGGLVALAVLAGPVVDRLRAAIGAPGPEDGLDLPGTGSLRPLALLLVLVAVAGALTRLRGRRVAAAAPTWACGQLVEPPLSWSGAGFSKPLRLILESVLRPRREVAVHAEGGVVQQVVYRGEVPNLIDQKVYRPLEQGALKGSAFARRLQAGSLGAYVAYLGGLVVVLLLLLRVGALG